nr:nucleolin-like [Quercus suber]
MKKVNAKGFDKDLKQSSLSQFKNQDKGKKHSKDGVVAATLSDIDLEDDSDDNDDEGILSAFTATINPTEGIVEEDDIHTAYTKLYKVSKKHEKLYRLATKKLSGVELDREELFTKFDEANQTIGARMDGFTASPSPKALEEEDDDDDSGDDDVDEDEEMTAS